MALPLLGEIKIFAGNFSSRGYALGQISCRAAASKHQR